MPTLTPEIFRVAWKLPPKKAVEYLKRKGFAIGYNWQDVWEKEHTKAFTVAKAMKLDLLQNILQAVQTAQKEGRTFDQFQRTLEPVLKLQGWWGRDWPENDQGLKVGPDGEPFPVDEETGEQVIPKDARPPLLGSPHRLKTIYITNMLQSYNAGRWDAQQESSFELLQYIGVSDDRQTALCASLHLRVYRKDDPIWKVFYPMNHWRCRSRVRAMSISMARRRGYQVSSSKGKIKMSRVAISRNSKEKREVATIDLGGKKYSTDPGFAYNPGEKQYEPDLKQYDKSLVKEYKKDAASSVRTTPS